MCCGASLNPVWSQTFFHGLHPSLLWSLLFYWCNGGLYSFFRHESISGRLWMINTVTLCWVFRCLWTPYIYIYINVILSVSSLVFVLIYLSIKDTLERFSIRTLHKYTYIMHGFALNVQVQFCVWKKPMQIKVWHVILFSFIKRLKLYLAGVEF